MKPIIKTTKCFACNGKGRVKEKDCNTGDIHELPCMECLETGEFTIYHCPKCNTALEVSDCFSDDGLDWIKWLKCRNETIVDGETKECDYEYSLHDYEFI